EAVGRLSRALRTKAGESLRTIQASNELERVTTPSLAALRKYVEGSNIADEGGDVDRALALLQEAVELDTAFAMAWRKIAVLLGNEGRDRPRALAANEKAFRNRDRLTEMERLLTVGYYYTLGPTPNREKALAAYEDALRIDSTTLSALNNSAVVYAQQYEFEKAEAMYRRVIRLPRTFGGAFGNLINMQVINRRSGAALDSTAAAFKAAFPNSADVWEGYWMAAWGKQDLAATDSIARQVLSTARTVSQKMGGARSLAVTAEMRGQLASALERMSIAETEKIRVDTSAIGRFLPAFDSALILAQGADRARAKAVIDRGMARVPMAQIPAVDRPWSELVKLASLLEDSSLARQAWQGWERDQRTTAEDSLGRRAYFEGYIALTTRHWSEAIRSFQDARARYEVFPREYLRVMAGVYDRLGQADSAIAYYEQFKASPIAPPSPGLNFVPRTYQRLGELYESKGDLSKAAENYARFIELWEKADPDLQPEVKEARARLAAIKQKTG
ncbi:MAG TPA: hypothetical protein VG817_09335, partial [Gemmatimonadales bacterium]|nr:hypothetical protein [Gemmatimonadales bacterium]